MNVTDKRIINAVIEKAERDYPGTLALIGIYGSALTGNTHRLSDLDLMIVINDYRGWGLARGFILDDTNIGYDIYCTTWEMLENDAKCGQAHISKLMDSEIVYIGGDEAMERLEELRKQAADTLASEDIKKSINGLSSELYSAYAAACTAPAIGKMRGYAANVIYLSLDIVMLSNGKYFRKGTKRTFEELEGLSLPDNFKDNIMGIVSARTMPDINRSLTALVGSVMRFMEQPRERSAPTEEALRGTYEEMFSNWRNKMPEAAERGDVFSSYMNLAAFEMMLSDISSEVTIPEFDVLGSFDPDDLEKNVTLFDNTLEQFGQEYEKLGIKPVRYADADEFVKNYLGK